MIPRIRMLPLAVLCAVVAAAGSAAASPPAAPAHVTVPTVAPRPADVGSIDGMINAMYDVLCVRPGQQPQWSRDRSLYVPDVRFYITTRDKSGQPSLRIVSHQEFVDHADHDMTANGFSEREIHRVTDRFGDIAHVFSTYEMRKSEHGPLIARGINSVELVFHSGRWWITSILWEDDGQGNTIPPQYLPAQR